VKILLIIILLVLLASLWFAYAFYTRVQISKQVVRVAVPYSRPSTDTRVSLLVLGDSTGVGVGASKPEDTVAGRLASRIDATVVENYAVSGAVVTDLLTQIKQAKLDEYSVILVQIGGNDIIRFHDSGTVGMHLAKALRSLPPAHSVFLMSAGNVGATTLFPFFIRPFHTSLTMKYHRVFERVASAADVEYINLYTPPVTDVFVTDPKKYFSADGLHPSSDGYGVWFEKLNAVLK
jgi:lysophospholipase L1-like esterase